MVSRTSQGESAGRMQIFRCRMLRGTKELCRVGKILGRFRRTRRKAPPHPSGAPACAVPGMADRGALRPATPTRNPAPRGLAEGLGLAEPTLAGYSVVGGRHDTDA